MFYKVTEIGWPVKTQLQDRDVVSSILRIFFLGKNFFQAKQTAQFTFPGLVSLFFPRSLLVLVAVTFHWV